MGGQANPSGRSTALNGEWEKAALRHDVVGSRNRSYQTGDAGELV